MLALELRVEAVWSALKPRSGCRCLQIIAAGASILSCSLRSASQRSNADPRISPWPRSTCRSAPVPTISPG